MVKNIEMVLERDELELLVDKTGPVERDGFHVRAVLAETQGADVLEEGEVIFDLLILGPGFVVFVLVWIARRFI